MRLPVLIIAGLLFTAELCAQDPPALFESTTAYSVGSTPRSVTAGDFNGDGLSDLVVVGAPGGTATNTIHVLLANVDGSFSPVDQNLGTANFRQWQPEISMGMAIWTSS